MQADTAENAQAQFEGWANVEMMGRQSILGFVRTQYFGTVVAFEVTQPEITPKRIRLDKPKYCQVQRPSPVVGRDPYLREELMAAGTEVEISRPAARTFVFATALYRLTPISEEQALLQMPLDRRVVQEVPALLGDGKPEPRFTRCVNCDEPGDNINQETGHCEDCEAEDDNDGITF